MLETLRAKPNHVKQVISIVVTLVIFSAILFVWVSSRDARSREMEVKGKTVSPLGGVTSMFDGLWADFKGKVSDAPSLENMNTFVATSTEKESFDLSRVVVIDASATTTVAR
ncbi:MAG: hypothetical protein Q7K40_04060 [bacterium]|nr:hypothetical protein [bacterium]